MIHIAPVSARGGGFQGGRPVSNLTSDQPPIFTMLHRLLLALSLAALPGQLAAQVITRDSLFDYVDKYWRMRLTLAMPSADTLTVTCDGGKQPNTWGAWVRFTAAAPWSPNAINASSSNIFGFMSASSSSRLDVRWPDGKRDEWRIDFSRSNGINWIGSSVTDNAAYARSNAGTRSGWLAFGDEFLKKMVAHRRVGITYPVADWVRSFEVVLDDPMHQALQQMYRRCSQVLEGTGQ